MPTRPSQPIRSPFRFRWILILSALIAIGVAGYLGYQELIARNHYRAALQAIKSRKLQEAITHLQWCAEAWPEDIKTALLLARTARRTGDLISASDELERAAKIDPTHVTLEIERALLESQQGRFQKHQERLLRAVRERHPDTAIIAEVVGPMFAQNLATEPARELFDEWAKASPDDPRPLMCIGDLSRWMRQPGVALEMYEKAVQLDPEMPEARGRLARQLLEVRQPEAALEILEPLIEKDASNREYRLLTARARSETGRTDPARELIEELRRESPRDPMILAERGRLELRLELYAEAERWLRQAHELMPFDAQICFSLAQALDGLARHDEAKRMRERHARIDADQQQIGTLLRVVPKQPNEIHPRIDLAILFRRTGQPDTALGWLRSAAAIDSRSPRLHAELANTYELLGDQEQMAYHRALAACYANNP